MKQLTMALTTDYGFFIDMRQCIIELLFHGALYSHAVNMQYSDTYMQTYQDALCEEG